MSCQALVELITRYLENDLAPTERAQFEAHLAACDGCRNYMAQFERTMQLVGQLPPIQLTSDMQAQLLDAFRTWHSTR